MVCVGRISHEVSDISHIALRSVTPNSILEAHLTPPCLDLPIHTKGGILRSQNASTVFRTLSRRAFSEAFVHRCGGNGRMAVILTSEWAALWILDEMCVHSPQLLLKFVLEALSIISGERVLDRMAEEVRTSVEINPLLTYEEYQSSWEQEEISRSIVQVPASHFVSRHICRRIRLELVRAETMLCLTQVSPWQSQSQLDVLPPRHQNC